MKAEPRPWRAVPLEAVPISRRAPAGTTILTITVRQSPTALHRVGYEQGWYILELDEDERPVRAYHRGAVN